jgi:hypothetical protein
VPVFLCIFKGYFAILRRQTCLSSSCFDSLSIIIYEAASLRGNDEFKPVKCTFIR